MTTKTTYQTFFSLSAEPYQKAISDEALHLSSSTLLLLEQVTSALRERQHAAIYGESGAGKTCLLRAVRHALPPEQFGLSYCAHVTLGRRDFYRQFAMALGLPPCGTAASLFNSIAAQVQDLGQNRIHPVGLALVLITDAHPRHQEWPFSESSHAGPVFLRPLVMSLISTRARPLDGAGPISP